MSNARDPRAVLAAADRKTAEGIADWLTEKGFPAEAVVVPMSTASDALTGASAAVPGEVEVRVTHPADVEKAKAALTEFAEEVKAVRARQEARAARTGTVTADCEDCGTPSDWPAAEAGKTQTCPHCHGYMDVPDPDGAADWEGVDFGTEDDEPDEKPAD